MPLVPHFGPSREPPSSPASEPGAGQRLGRSRRRRPEGKGNTRELRTYSAAAPGRRGWTRASGTVTVTGTVTGSVPRAGAGGYKGRKAGAGPAAGKLQLHLPPREGNREIPSAGKRPAAECLVPRVGPSEGLSPVPTERWMPGPALTARGLG